MNPRVEFEMSEAQLKSILDACRPTLVMKIGSYEGSSPQENANAAWQRLGREMGFDYMTARSSDKGERFFTAVPSETKAQCEAREHRQREERDAERRKQLTDEIATRQAELDRLARHAPKAEGDERGS